MELIFGGAYQGRLEYAKSKYNLRDEDIFFCSEERAEIDLSKPVIYCMEKFLLACIREGNITPALISFFFIPVRLSMTNQIESGFCHCVRPFYEFLPIFLLYVKIQYLSSRNALAPFYPKC